MLANYSQRIRIDWLLIGQVALVPFLGLIVLYSAGYLHDEARASRGVLSFFRLSPPFTKQLIFLLGGACVAAVCASIPSRWYYRIAPFVYLVGLLLLVAVALVGSIKNGSRRWLPLGGGLNLQPSEFMKLGVILLLARLMSKRPPPSGGYRLVDLAILCPLFVLPMVLIVKQPDLGTALSVGAVGGMMLLFAGIRPRALLVLFIAALIALVPLWMSLHRYQKNRVLALLNAEQDPKGTGYHIIQSKIAVGSGELVGKGFLKGTQNQLEFLPEHTTDFIFSVLAEEWGFIGCVLVLGAYLSMLSGMLRVAAKTRDLFSAFLVVGITAQVFFHTFINIGMVVGILPVVGIPLPLFSYGGSSVLSTMVGVGIVFSMSLRRSVPT